jgi:beta-fructofuranosidase
VPAGYSSNQFRDPTTAWKGPDGVWRLLVGANAGEGGTVGTALLYKSLDFQAWNFSQRLHSVAGTGMWECPDFYPVPSSGALLGAETSTSGPTVKHVLKISANDMKHDYYSVGTYVPENDTFLPESVNLDAGIGLRYDYGKFYASKSFFDQFKSRRILFGWVNESDTQDANIQKGWASVMVGHLFFCSQLVTIMSWDFGAVLEVVVECTA